MPRPFVNARVATSAGELLRTLVHLRTRLLRLAVTPPPSSPSSPSPSLLSALASEASCSLVAGWRLFFPSVEAASSVVTALAAIMRHAASAATPRGADVYLPGGAASPPPSASPPPPGVASLFAAVADLVAASPRCSHLALPSSIAPPSLAFAGQSPSLAAAQAAAEGQCQQPPGRELAQARNGHA